MGYRLLLLCLVPLVIAGCNPNAVIGHYTLYEYKISTKKDGELEFGSRLLGTAAEHGNNLTSGAPYTLFVMIRMQESILTGSCDVSFKDISLTNQGNGEVTSLDPFSAEKSIWLSNPHWLWKPHKEHGLSLDFAELELPYADYVLKYDYSLTEGCGVSPLTGKVELLNETDFKEFDVTVWYRFVNST